MIDETLYFFQAHSVLSLHHQTQNNKSKNPNPSLSVSTILFPPLKTFEKPFELKKEPRAFQLAPFSYLL